MNNFLSNDSFLIQSDNGNDQRIGVSCFKFGFRLMILMFRKIYRSVFLFGLHVVFEFDFAEAIHKNLVIMKISRMFLTAGFMLKSRWIQRKAQKNLI